MCGLSGLIHTDGRPVDQGILRRMNDRIAHRGPDGDGFFWGDGVALGHRRLSIIDIDGSPQPMFSADERVVLSFNGEIYNYKWLRDELRALGHSFRTEGDTEVLLNAYLEWGEACVNRLRGMFAFAIWDNRKRCLFLARDRVGIKPLYYAPLPEGGYVFASELKAIIEHPSVRCRIRVDAVEDFLALGYVPDPKSVLDGVHKLPPGTTLSINRETGNTNMVQYWQPDIMPSAVCEPMQGELLERLEEAVKMRMVADVPLGAFLSGGVDSSVIVGLMSKNSEAAVETCSIGSDDPEFDESGYAEQVAEHFGTSHRLRLSDAKDGALLKILPGVFDEPFADLSAIPTYRVCGLAREKVTVALSGDGGDELFGGYRRYRFHMMEEKLRALMPAGLRRAIFGPLGRVYPKLDWAPQFLRAKSTFEGLARNSAEAYFQSVAKTPDRDRVRLHTRTMKQHLAGYHPQDLFVELSKDVHGCDPLSLIQYIDFKTYLPGDILTKVDRTSMAHSLEVRVPILDHKFVEWGLRLSPESRIVDGEGKAPFKQAVRGFIPDDIIDRPKKGFNVPASQWMREELAPAIKGLARSERLLDTGLIDGSGMSAMIEEHLSGKRDHHMTLWCLMMLEGSLETLDASL